MNWLNYLRYQRPELFAEYQAEMAAAENLPAFERVIEPMAVMQRWAKKVNAILSKPKQETR